MNHVAFTGMTGGEEIASSFPLLEESVYSVLSESSGLAMTRKREGLWDIGRRITKQLNGFLFAQE